MKLLRCLGTLALSALLSQSVAAKETVAAVRYRLVGQPNRQEGLFRSISTHGLILAHHADAPLDTLPLSVLKAVEVDRGIHTKASSVVSLAFLGMVVGGVLGGHKEQGGFYDLGTRGAIMGGAVGLAIGAIPVRRWEHVHGWSVVARPIAPSSYAMVLKSQF